MLAPVYEPTAMTVTFSDGAQTSDLIIAVRIGKPTLFRFCVHRHVR